MPLNTLAVIELNAFAKKWGIEGFLLITEHKDYSITMTYNANESSPVTSLLPFLLIENKEILEKLNGGNANSKVEMIIKNPNG